MFYYAGDYFEELQLEHYNFPAISQYKSSPLSSIPVFSSDPLTFLFFAELQYVKHSLLQAMMILKK